MLKTMDPDFINWVKSQLDEQAAKTKRILTALLHLFRPSWWKKIGNGLRGVFLTILVFFHFASAFIPVPFSAYMAQQKSGTYYSWISAIQSNTIG